MSFLGIGLSYRFPKESIVFHAEIFATYIACKLRVHNDICGNIGVFVDSQAALMTRRLAVAEKISTSSNICG